MEVLQNKHREERQDLVSRITQKKKSATKKTRKGVNDECAELERQLEQTQSAELAELEGEPDISQPESASVKTKTVNETNKPEVSSDLKHSTDSLNVRSSPASNGQIRKPNRQKVRLARRVAEQEAAAQEAAREAACLPNLRDNEREQMRDAYTSKGLTEHEIRSDGHCLYAAVADQLTDSGIGLKPRIQLEIAQGEDWASASRYRITRHVAASYIAQNSDDFAPFLEISLEDYVKTIRDTGEWGGHLEILALAKAYGVDINVLQANGRVEKVESGMHTSSSPVWLAYYHHSYGLGEHYNSLRQTK